MLNSNTCREPRRAPPGGPYGLRFAAAPRDSTSQPDSSGRMKEYAVNDIVTGFKWVGTRPIRPDGVPKETGRAMYAADMAMPGQLVGKILRSPHAHARIKSIDTSKAAELP